MPKTTSGGVGDAGAPFTLPSSLDDLTPEQLAELRASAEAEFDQIYDQDGGPKADQLTRATELADAIDVIGQRATAIETEAAETQAQFDALRARRAGEDVANAPVGDLTDTAPAVLEGEVPAAPAAPAPQLVSASGRPTGGAVTASRDTGGLQGGKSRLNPSLSNARAAAPTVQAPTEDLPITASVGLPGQFEPGARIGGLRALGELAEKRAKGMPNAAGRGSGRRDQVARYDAVRVNDQYSGARRNHDDPYGGVQIASIANPWETKFSDDSSVEAVQAYIEKVQGNRLASKFEPIVAAGGWCAPSQNRYDFFNIACEGGMIDLPTFGVERGGINFPVSPSLADTFSPALPWYTAFSSATVPWLWTETDDIASVTGTPNKPCIRVPCSSMTNVRLECYGICLTAGNLADNAWPESTRNFLRLLMSAHYHAQNARYISQIVTAASTPITGCTPVGEGAAAPLLGTAELGAWDYRTKFGMCDDDVVEWILPAWSKGAVRADLAKRTGVSDFMCVPDSAIAQWFDCRNIRTQFVDDFQVRAAGQPGAATPITQYPSLVNGLMYAAGTVARGNGMSLDLGVVRDSTLNAENDFTAAWMEECHLIARFGHEVRNYQIRLCPDGTTGANDITGCCP
jgi:hypothetical protein